MKRVIQPRRTGLHSADHKEEQLYRRSFVARPELNWKFQSITLDKRHSRQLASKGGNRLAASDLGARFLVHHVTGPERGRSFLFIAYHTPDGRWSRLRVN